jgi:selenocysteine-specific elongation factor
MKPVIVGTAGHIDHGKTALVRALTGIDADRLEEEKRRGITIDLGFAHLELPSPNGEPLRLGFIDVPGHEKFVRNMLAGVGGIDLVLFVIAADEGIKPQTREHFDICRLLGLQRGLTVLTKSDLVDRETLDVVRSEVGEFVRGSFLGGAPIVPVSSTSGAGIDALKRDLARAAAAAASKPADAPFRLPIDRVFTMKGFGTVVTGTLISGALRKEEEVEILPAGKRARVRGVQVHGAPAEQARAGERTAVNLAAVATQELRRGDVLAAPGLFRPTRTADVEITLLEGVRPLRDRTRFHFHSYTSELIAGITRVTQILPGQTAIARLRFAKPLLLLPGDRFILRQFSPVITIGGGVVLDALPLRVKDDVRRNFLAAIQGAPPESVLKLRAALHGDKGLGLADAVAETGWLPQRLEALAAPLVKSGALVRISDRWLHPPALEALGTWLLETLGRFHDANPLAPGISRERLREALDADPMVLANLLETLSRQRKLEATADLVRLPGRGVQLKDEEAQAKQTIESAFQRAGLSVPALKDVLASLPLDRARAQKLVTLLLRDRVLVKISDDLVFHRDALAQLRAIIANQKATRPQLDVAAFKQLTGITRKYAIPLLEWLDRERVTRRVGDHRVIL